MLPPDFGLHYKCFLPDQVCFSSISCFSLLYPLVPFLQYINVFLLDILLTLFFKLFKIPRGFLFSPYFPVRPMVTQLPVPESPWVSVAEITRVLMAHCLSVFWASCLHPCFLQIGEILEFLQFSSFLFCWLLFSTFPLKHWSSLVLLILSLFALHTVSLETTSKCPSQILPLYLRSMDQPDIQYHYLVVLHLSAFLLNNLFLLNLLTWLITPTVIPATGLSFMTPDEFSDRCSGPASCIAQAPLACECQFACVTCCGMTSHNTCVCTHNAGTQQTFNKLVNGWIRGSLNGSSTKSSLRPQLSKSSHSIL